MRSGYTIVEVLVVLAVMTVLTGLGLPHLSRLRDRIAVERAASEVTSGIAAARHAAMLRAAKTRLVLQNDSLRFEEWQGQTWRQLNRWLGPSAHEVQLTTSNGIITFNALGIGAGLSNTTIRLSKGLQNATITVSRIGRVKRW